MQTSGDALFTTSDLWVALGFVAGTVAMAPFDRSLAGTLQDSTLQVHQVLRGLADTFRTAGWPEATRYAAPVL